MENSNLKTYILFIKGSEGNDDFEAEVKAKNQTRALEKILIEHPKLKENFDRFELLDCLGIKS